MPDLFATSARQTDVASLDPQRLDCLRRHLQEFIDFDARELAKSYYEPCYLPASLVNESDSRGLVAQASLSWVGQSATCDCPLVLGGDRFVVERSMGIEHEWRRYLWRVVPIEQFDGETFDNAGQEQRAIDRYTSGVETALEERANRRGLQVSIAGKVHVLVDGFYVMPDDWPAIKEHLEAEKASASSVTRQRALRP